jgi:Flp pilus assembly protein TadD
MAILESYCALDFFTGRKPFIPFIVLHQPPVQGGIGLSPKFAKLQSRGKIEEAVTEMEQAARLDPLSPPINHHLAFTYFSNGRYDDALEQIDRILESDSTHRASIELQGLCLLMKGEIEKAIETLEQYQALTGSDAKGVTPLDFAYAKAGRIEDARNCRGRNASFPYDNKIQVTNSQNC